MFAKPLFLNPQDRSQVLNSNHASCRDIAYGLPLSHFWSTLDLLMIDTHFLPAYKAVSDMSDNTVTPRIDANTRIIFTKKPQLEEREEKTKKKSRKVNGRV